MSSLGRRSLCPCAVGSDKRSKDTTSGQGLEPEVREVQEVGGRRQPRDAASRPVNEQERQSAGKQSLADLNKLE